MPRWVPIGWARRSPPGRSADLARWERDALRPGYGLPFGVSYTLAGTSSLERAEFARFFRPYTMRLAPGTAAGIGAEPGQRVLCYPRQAFDLWATRYFILPTDPADWAQGNRAFLTFLDRTEPVYPAPAGPEVPRGPRLDDVQIRRNLAAFPRAWTVHDAVVIDPGRAGSLLRALARGEPAGPGTHAPRSTRARPF
jgi:hypothetical protein